MKNLEEQAKEYLKAKGINSVDEGALNYSDNSDYINERILIQLIVGFANSLTPQPIKVDAETGEELERPNYGMDGQYDHHYKNYAEAPTPLEFIKRQKEILKELKKQILTKQIVINQLKLKANKELTELKEVWISVKDRLPEHQSNVLVLSGKIISLCFHVKAFSEVFECDEDECDYFDYDENKQEAFWKEGWYEETEQFQSEYDSYWQVKTPTHWMPLPKPLD